MSKKKATANSQTTSKTSLVGILGTVAFNSATRTAAGSPGRYTVFLSADAVKQAGENMMGPATYNIYSSGSVVASGALQFHAGDTWIRIVTNVFNPDLAKVFATFMPAGGGGPTTITDTAAITDVAIQKLTTNAKTQGVRPKLLLTAAGQQNTQVCASVSDSSRTHQPELAEAKLLDSFARPICDYTDMGSCTGGAFNHTFKNARNAKYVAARVVFSNGFEIESFVSL